MDTALCKLAFTNKPFHIVWYVYAPKCVVMVNLPCGARCKSRSLIVSRNTVATSGIGKYLPKHTIINKEL